MPGGTSGETVEGVPTGSLGDVMRLIGVLALAAPVAIGALALFVPDALISWIDEGVRSVLAAIAAGAIGVSLTALVVGAHFRFRFSRLVKAAEQIAGGRLHDPGPGAAASVSRAAWPSRSTTSRAPWPTPTTGRRSTG